MCLFCTNILLLHYAIADISVNRRVPPKHRTDKKQGISNLKHLSPFKFLLYKYPSQILNHNTLTQYVSANLDLALSFGPYRYNPMKMIPQAAANDPRMAQPFPTPKLPKSGCEKWMAPHAMALLKNPLDANTLAAYLG